MTDILLERILDEIRTLNANETGSDTTVADLLTDILAEVVASSRTHNPVISTGVGSVPAGSLRGSVLNAGNVAGTWNGISLPAGISIPWEECGNRDTYGVMNFDATGTTFIIEYTT